MKACRAAERQRFNFLSQSSYRWLLLPGFFSLDTILGNLELLPHWPI
jgi:hypothetical protein